MAEAVQEQAVAGKATGNFGQVVQISGPAVDVQFEESRMPGIFQALRVVSEGFNVPSPIDVVLEVQQHIGDGRVRCVAMEATEGMVRGMKDHGAGRARNAGPHPQRHRAAGR